MRQDGAIFASGGSDCVVRAYDEATCSLCRTLDHGDGVTTTGHTNHVFSLAWHPDDPQVLLSGSWDNRVLVWDLRVHRYVIWLGGHEGLLNIRLCMNQSVHCREVDGFSFKELPS
ncbi:hypothetical protein Vretimale_17957 [Volvox reticuliferus]|nr:hypothetical protein Vretimale_17957 [Volvox reticuliferus]